MSASEQETHPTKTRLQTWGEIATYLGKSVRTVQLWEKTRELPIHRTDTGIFAYIKELDEWLRQREIPVQRPPVVASPEPPTARRPSKVLIAVLVAGGILGVAALYWPREPVANPDLRILDSAHMPIPRLFGRDAAEGGQPRVIRFTEPFNQIIASHDLTRAYLAAHTTRKVALIDAASLQVQTWEAPVPIRTIALSPDGRRLFIGAFTDGLVQMDANTGRVVDQIPTGGSVSEIAFSPNGRRVYLAMMHRGVRRYSLDTGHWRQITTLGCPYNCTTDPQGNKLLVTYQCGGPGGREGHDAIEIFDLKTENSLSVFSGPPIVGEQSVFFSDGDRVWIAGGDACSRDIYDRKGCPDSFVQIHHIYRSSDKQLLQSFSVPVGSGLPPRLFADGRRVLTGSGRGATVFETARFAALEAYPLPAGDPASGAAFLDRGRKALVTFPTSKTLRIFSADAAGCDDLGPAAVNRLSGDGTEHDSIDNAQVRPPTFYAPGVIGQAFKLDGEGLHSVHTTSDFRHGTIDSTVSLYFKPLEVTEEDVPLLEGGDGAEHWRLLFGTKGIEYRILRDGFSAIVLKANRLVAAGEWTHVAVTQTDRTLTLFVNGTPVRNVVVSPGALRIARDIKFYRLGWSSVIRSRYRGLIDEINVWSRAINPDEVHTLYRRRRESPCKP